MLSPAERHQLGEIEQHLTASDPELADILSGSTRPGRKRRWPLISLLAVWLAFAAAAIAGWQPGWYLLIISGTLALAVYSGHRCAVAEHPPAADQMATPPWIRSYWA